MPVTVPMYAPAAAAFLQSVDWPAVAKTWGPLGIVFVVAIIVVVAAAKWVKGLLTDTIADARKERDRMAAQLDAQAKDFTAALKYRDDKFEDLISALDRVGRRK